MAFRLSDNRCEEIKKIVVDTFVRLNIRCVPISGFEIATKLGAKIIPYSSQTEEARQLMMLRSEDGFTMKYDGLWYIFYNDKKGYGRSVSDFASYTPTKEHIQSLPERARDCDL